jgi:hypothetical protein
VILPDINLLIYAHNELAPQHTKARDWWEECMNGRVTVGLSWLVMSGFIRLMTHPRVLKNPMKVTEAIKQTQTWLQQAPVRIINPGTAFSSLFYGYLEQLGTGGNLTTDTQLAALAVEHQAELHSCDADFSRFSGLRWRNPLY